MTSNVSGISLLLFAPVESLQIDNLGKHPRLWTFSNEILSKNDLPFGIQSTLILLPGSDTVQVFSGSNENLPF